MIVTLTISILLVVLYVGAAIRKKCDLPDSISGMVYVLPKGGWRWLWTIWIWIVGFILAPCLIGALDESFRFLGFVTIVMLIFCGAMPLFDKDNNALHNFFGVSACVLSQVCVTIICPWCLLFWTILIGVCVYDYFARNYPKWLRGKGVFIAETICFMALVCALFIRVLSASPVAS